MSASLREVLASWQRKRALIRLREAAADGWFDLALLEDKRNYRH
jgi:hypothetical protein